MKQKDILLTIMTPAYNRGQLLKRCYQTLKEQRDQRFEWLIVDDGSSDDTRLVAEQFIEENVLSIQYIYKENGGKHTAINQGVRYAAAEKIIILDSDDYLIPDAVGIINQEWGKYCNEKSFGGLTFLRGYSPEMPIGRCFPQNYMISNYIDTKLNQKIIGDKAEVFLSSALKEFPFPEIEGERFLGEAVVWIPMARKYNMVYINKIIYITEYLPGGLTKQGRKLRIQNPVGGMLYANELLGSGTNIKTKIKGALLFNAYVLFSGKSIKEGIMSANSKVLVTSCMPLGLALWYYWKNRFLD